MTDDELRNLAVTIFEGFIESARNADFKDVGLDELQLDKLYAHLATAKVFYQWTEGELWAYEYETE